MKKTLSIVLSVIAVSIILPSIALAAWWNPFTWNIWKFFPQFNKPVKTEVIKVATTTNNQTATTTSQKQTNIPAGYVTYKNDKYGFEIIIPNTTCLLSNHGVFLVVIKNCELFVFGPAFAIDNIPG